MGRQVDVSWCFCSNDNGTRKIRQEKQSKNDKTRKREIWKQKNHFPFSLLNGMKWMNEKNNSKKCFSFSSIYLIQSFQHSYPTKLLRNKTSQTFPIRLHCIVWCGAVAVFLFLHHLSIVDVALSVINAFPIHTNLLFIHPILYFVQFAYYIYSHCFQMMTSFFARNKFKVE